MIEENKQEQSKSSSQKVAEQQLDQMKTGKTKSTEKKPGFLFTIFQKYFYYFVIIEMIIVAGAGYWFLLKPKISTTSTKDVEVILADEKTQAKIDDYNEQIIELNKIKEAYDKISDSNIDKVNNMLPDNPGERELFLQIEKIVKANGLLLDSIFLENEDKESASAKKRSKRDLEAEKELVAANEGKAKEIKIKFAVSEVSYPAFKSLLGSLESNLRIINVDSVDYQPEDRSAEILIKAYYLPSTS